MNKLMLVFLLLGVASGLYAATVTQPTPSAISVLTPAQVLASTPTYVGQVIVCNGCTTGNVGLTSLCISTETTSANNGYIIVSSAVAISTCK